MSSGSTTVNQTAQPSDEHVAQLVAARQHVRLGGRHLAVVQQLLDEERTAETAEARAAYAAIGRRVGALSIVHRNHFAEMEENLMCPPYFRFTPDFRRRVVEVLGIRSPAVRRVEDER